MPHGLRLIARLEHGMALALQGVPQHRPQRVLVFDDENLGRCGAHADGDQRSQPGGTPALRASSSMSAICFLLFSMSHLHAIELGQGLLALVGDLRALEGIVARGEIGGQRVDAALQRLGEHLVAPQLVARLRDADPATLLRPSRRPRRARPWPPAAFPSFGASPAACADGASA